ncbi:MAG: ectoine synthase [Dehalogenimonas sp.]|uniref:L-ectoine synthase n=1 Tax=Candidatus Dehalogenimonas loeffleri TaxID=3127115 RepID=A0ABZ2JBH1_9CHLR|nr:ectoine synthase [Dehalogenimonas sp.]
MIIRTIAECTGNEREIKAPNGNWVSRRLLLRDDGMGFSFHETIIHAGSETPIWYKNHLEAVYCVAGNGSIEDLATGEVHQIEPGVLYALDKHDRHILRGGTVDMKMICVFTPPLRGDEVHDADGAYQLHE